MELVMSLKRKVRKSRNDKSRAAMAGEEIVKVSKALSDENRYEILRMITQTKEKGCFEITENSPLSQPTVSYHLKILTDANLINCRKEGQRSYFSINREVFEKYIKAIQKELLS